MNEFLVFAFLFFIGSCMGWGIEVFFRRFVSRNNPEKKWINPGFLTGPYLPIYGFGLWGMYFVSMLSSMALTGNEVIDTVIILVIMTAAMTLIEYIAGLIFIRGMKVRLWDYSREKFNFQGIICPKFSMAWGILGCFYYFVINPYVIDWVVWLSYHLAFSFVIGMFFGVFAIDVCYSFNVSAKIRRFAEEKEAVIKYEELKDFLGRRKEELHKKRGFMFSFNTGEPVLNELERYFENVRQQRIKKTADVKEAIRKKRGKGGKCKDEKH